MFRIKSQYVSTLGNSMEGTQNLTFIYILMTSMFKDHNMYIKFKYYNFEFLEKLLSQNSVSLSF